MGSFWDFVDNRFIIRRITLGVMLSLGVATVYWAMDFAQTSDRPGADVALIIAAVLTPVAALQKFIGDMYSQGRNP